MASKWLSSHDWTNHQISFKPNIVNQLDPAAQKLAVLVSNEFEGITQNGGIGTYYSALSQKLMEDGWLVILLLCQSETAYRGESYSELVHHVFSTCEVTELLVLCPIHQCLLDTAQQDKVNRSFDFQSLCCLFFIQALATDFPDAVIYAEFPEIWGFGYRTIQAKQSGWLSHNCLTGVTSHGSFEWLREINSQYQTDNPQWFWQAHHYEQFSYENADVVHAPSHFLKAKVGSYGWKTEHVKHLPYFVPIVQAPQKVASPQIVVPDAAIPVVFFGRLEERKGLCAFIEAIKCLDKAIADQLHIMFMGKVIPLQSSHLAPLNSQQYIDRELGDAFSYTLHTDLFSQAAIAAIANLITPIVCLTSLQENFPNTALEMGQLPVRLVVSDTGGFQETLALVQRTEAVHWFHPDHVVSLAQALTQAVQAIHEQPIIPDAVTHDRTNQRLLNQRLEYMSDAFLDAAPKEPFMPEITLVVTSATSADVLLECLTSLAAQTYEALEVIVMSSTTVNGSVTAIAQAQLQFPQYKYLQAAPDSSLGAAYNQMVEQAAGEYVIFFAADQVAAPHMVERLVIAANEAEAAAVVCPQLVAAADQPAAITAMDGNLLKLLEFNHRYDLIALFAKSLLQTFPYSEEQGLMALNWQIFAAAIATDQAIAYYPYPLYAIHAEGSASIPPASLAKERYYLRQFLFQIPSEQWHRRQINLLLMGFEQIRQQTPQPLSMPRYASTSPQDQAWQITAQQIHCELVQAQVRLQELEPWHRELKTAKEWLESQWQTWMLKAQKAEAEAARLRSLTQQIQVSKFWRLRRGWLKLKKRLGRFDRDPLLPPTHTYEPGVQDVIARMAGQKIRFFQPETTGTPVVSIISSCAQDYEYLETTYRSVTNQTLQNFEWLLVKDASVTSEYNALLTTLPQRTPKIRLLSQETQGNITSNYNAAIAQAQGKYLCFVDIGAVLDPTYLEKCVLFLETHAQVSVVNSYSVVFQGQEHWWQPSLNASHRLLYQSGLLSHPVYRKTDFEKVGDFDESLADFADWERCLKALAHHQIGWTLPEYLDGYRATTITAPAITQLPTAELEQAIAHIQSRYHHKASFDNQTEASLEPQSLNLSALKSNISIPNSLPSNPLGKGVLLFCDALDDSENTKWNCDLVTCLEQQGYHVSIVTTSNAEQTLQEFFYPTTPDIFHLANLVDKAHWLACIRYLIDSRQINAVLVSGSVWAYPFLSVLQAEFPQCVLIDCVYAGKLSQQNEVMTRSRQFNSNLDYHIVSSRRQAKEYADLKALSKIKVCCSALEAAEALVEAVNTDKAFNSTRALAETAHENLQLLLEYLAEM